MWALKRVGPAVLVMMVSLAVSSTARAAVAEQPTPTPSATDTGTGTPTPSVTDTDTGTPTPSATDTGTPTASPTTQTQDTQFLQLIHRVNLAEVRSGNLAKQRGQNASVKDLGQMFVTDHTQLDQAVQQAARSSGVTLPGAPTADQQAALNRLRAANGANFDTLWITTELSWHLQSLAAINNELTAGSDQTVTQLAQQAQPTFQRHLDELRALAQSMGIPIPTASATPTGTASPTRPGTSTPSTPSTPRGTATTPSMTETPTPTGS